MTQKPPYLRFEKAALRLQLDPREPQFFQNPYYAYAFMHAVPPAFFWEDFGIWCVTSFDGVSSLLRDRRFGRENPQGPPAPQPLGSARGHVRHFDALEEHSLLELEPPSHTRLRTLVNRAFVSRQVERLRPRLEALSHQLIDEFESAGETELISAYATPLPVAVISGMLGIDEAMGSRLLDWSHAMVAMYAFGRTREIEERADLASKEFAAFIRSELKFRRNDAGEDLLSLLAAAEADGEKLTEDELVSTAVLLLNAGHEATVHQTGNAVKSLLEQFDNPADHFTSDRSAAAAVEEALRFDAPLHMFTRYANHDIAPGTAFSGSPGELALKRGEKIGLLLGAANRDPKAFRQPDQYDPQRPNQKNVSFGAGIHFCVGAPLARLELQVSLRVLFQRAPRIRLAATPCYRDSFHFHGLESLRVAI